MPELDVASSSLLLWLCMGTITILLALVSWIVRSVIMRVLDEIKDHDKEINHVKEIIGAKAHQKEIDEVYTWAQNQIQMLRDKDIREVKDEVRQMRTEFHSELATAKKEIRTDIRDMRDSLTQLLEAKVQK